MANAFQSLGFQHNFGFQGGSGVTPPPTPTSTVGGGGKRERQRRRIVVEIDGEEFVVQSEAEARALLAQTQALAQQQATIAAKAALNRARKLRRKTGGLRLPTMEVAIPEIRVRAPEANPDIAAMFVASQRAIDETYLRAAQALEMAYLAKREYLLGVDDDEVMTVLMHLE